MVTIPPQSSFPPAPLPQLAQLPQPAKLPATLTRAAHLQAGGVENAGPMYENVAALAGDTGATGAKSEVGPFSWAEARGGSAPRDTCPG